LLSKVQCGYQLESGKMTEEGWQDFPSFSSEPLLWAGCSGLAFLLMVDAAAELIDLYSLLITGLCEMIEIGAEEGAMANGKGKARNDRWFGFATS